jgi:hypothetical protein
MGKDNMNRYSKAYDDCKAILGGEKCLDSFSHTPAPKPTDEQLDKFNNYLKGFLDETDSGMLRTLLVIGKPFKHEPIVKDTLELLADKLRVKSGTGKI